MLRNSILHDYVKLSNHHGYLFANRTNAVFQFLSRLRSTITIRCFSSQLEAFHLGENIRRKNTLLLLALLLLLVLALVVGVAVRVLVPVGADATSHAIHHVVDVLGVQLVHLLVMLLRLGGRAVADVVIDGLGERALHTRVNGVGAHARELDMQLARVDEAEHDLGDDTRLQIGRPLHDFDVNYRFFNLG